MHEYTKPGGSIDQKMKLQSEKQQETCVSHQKTFRDDIVRCKQDHSFIRKLSIFNKTGNTLVDSLKIVGFFIFLILSGWGWVESVAYRKEAQKDKQERIQLTKKVQMLEKIIAK